MQRDLRFPARTPQQIARAAVVTQDDVLHAQQSVEKHSPRLARILDAVKRENPDARTE